VTTSDVKKVFRLSRKGKRFDVVDILVPAVVSIGLSIVAAAVAAAAVSIVSIPSLESSSLVEFDCSPSISTALMFGPFQQVKANVVPNTKRMEQTISPRGTKTRIPIARKNRTTQEIATWLDAEEQISGSGISPRQKYFRIPTFALSAINAFGGMCYATTKKVRKIISLTVVSASAGLKHFTRTKFKLELKLCQICVDLTMPATQ